MAKKRKQKESLKSLRQKTCERCGERDGVLNSRFSHDNPKSDLDCGDWVCCECEEELEAEFHEDEFYL